MSVDTRVVDSLEVPQQEKSYQDLLIDAAAQLRETGQYSTELSATQLQSLMHEVVLDQMGELLTKYVPEKQRSKLQSHLDNLSVNIDSEKAHVSAGFTGGFKWGLVNWSQHLDTTLTLGNVPDSPEEEGIAPQPHKIQTEAVTINPPEISLSKPVHIALQQGARLTGRNVEIPQTFQLETMAQNMVKGQEVNTLFMKALNLQLGSTHQTQVNSIGLQFTPQNTLKIDLKGGILQHTLPTAA